MFVAGFPNPVRMSPEGMTRHRFAAAAVTSPVVDVVVVLDVVFVDGVHLLAFRFRGEGRGPLISTWTPLPSLRALTRCLQ